MQSLLSKIKQFFSGSKKQATTKEQLGSTLKKQQNIEPTQTPPQITAPSISAEEKKVRIALEDIDLQNPERSEKFLEIIPVLHKYSIALSFISRYNKVAAYYSKTILDQNGNRLPFEIEKAVIESKHCNLLFELSIQGHTWSNNAKELMKQHHRVVYCHLFGYI